MGLIFKIKRWYFEIRHKIRMIGDGIHNLRYWFRIIWNDRWWDFTFLYLILRHKLADMEEGFRKHGMSTRSKEDAHNIKICVLLLDRLIKNDYYDYKKPTNHKHPLAEMHKESEMITQDMDLLFKILRRQLECWWD